MAENTYNTNNMKKAYKSPVLRYADLASEQLLSGSLEAMDRMGRGEFARRHHEFYDPDEE